MDSKDKTYLLSAFVGWAIGLAIVVLAIGILTAIASAGQCGPNGCSAVGRVRAVPEWEWKYEGEKGYLYRYGSLYGTWDWKLRRWFPVIDGTAAPFKLPAACADGCSCDLCGDDCQCSGGKPCSDSCSCVTEGCPCDGKCDKCSCKDGKPCDKNFGVNLGMLARPEKGRTIYRHNGVEVAKEVAYEAIGSRIPDDTGKLWLTAIGEKGKEVLADIAKSKAFDGLRDKLILKSYSATHWVVDKMGYVTTGHPTIYLQAADGKVLHRQDDYDGGVEALAEAVRKANPDYKPKADPDLRKPSLPLHNIPVGPLLIFGAAAGVYFYSSRKV